MPRARREPLLPPLLPAPNSAQRLAGHLRLRPRLPIVLDPRAGDSDFDAARALQAVVHERCGARLAIETHARCDDLGPRIELRRDTDLGEAHRIEVSPERARLVGSGAPGLRYAVETLAQLVDERGFVPACRIEDAPVFDKRGIMLDVSRGKV